MLPAVTRRGKTEKSARPAPRLSREEVRGSLRFSFSQYTTREEIDYVVMALVEIVARLREMAPDDDAPGVQNTSAHIIRP